MKIAIAQINPTVGDLVGNVKKITDWIIRATQEGADLIIFPEMSLTGYPIWDLANKPDFLKAQNKYLRNVAKSIRGKEIAVVLGCLSGIKNSKQVYNSLVWLEHGKILFNYHKQLLPTYDVFLEGIFFKAGQDSKIHKFKGMKFGFTICEDIWDENYLVKPIKKLISLGAELIINISASPFYAEVNPRRQALLATHAKINNVPIVYVNQVGVQDDLIFDGQSIVVDKKGNIVHRSSAFEESLSFVRIDGKDIKNSSERLADIKDPIEYIYQALVFGIKDYCRKNGFKKAVIGLSGGIDSALVAALAVDALGPSSVLGVTMPGKYSSTGSWVDAETLANNLGMEFRKFPIVDLYHKFVSSNEREFPKNVSLAMENLQARLRGLQLMYLSNNENRILLTTGNKSELAMGYCTLYGDMAGGLSVIGDVFKTDVYKLAEYRNRIGGRIVIPKSTLMKPPSAELRPNQKDQDSLPPYTVLDEILRLYIEHNLSRDQIANKMKRKGVKPELVNDVIRKTDHNEYKRRQTPPILRVSQKAWFGRRMPITNRFDIDAC